MQFKDAGNIAHTHTSNICFPPTVCVFMYVVCIYVYVYIYIYVYKGPPAQESTWTARLKFINDSEDNWVKVLWSDETEIQFFGINST